jgi:hypothetical protein
MVALAKKPSRLIESLATNELLTDAQKPMVAGKPKLNGAAATTTIFN